MQECVYTVRFAAAMMRDILKATIDAIIEGAEFSYTEERNLPSSCGNLTIKVRSVDELSMVDALIKNDSCFNHIFFKLA